MLFFWGVISSGCSNSYDDSALWNSVSDLENRVVKLEELCCQMNVNISSLREIVTALQKNETIKSVESLPDGSGYQITFSSNKKIIVYHGKNGIDGEDGKNGANGITPVISVKKDIDGIYYWTVDGAWLTDEAGNKVMAEGSNGITPRFKIESGYWFVSYDGEQTWNRLGIVTGNGGDPSEVISLIESIQITNGYLCLVLNDADKTQIEIPILNGLDDVCTAMDDIVFMQYCYENFDVNKDGKVSQAEANAVLELLLCDYENRRNIISLKGIEYFLNLRALDCRECVKLEEVDLHYNTKIVKLSNLQPNWSTREGVFDGCKCLKRLDLPASIISLSFGNQEKSWPLKSVNDDSAQLQIICRAVDPPTLSMTRLSGCRYVLFVPDESIEKYRNSSWRDFDIYKISSLE